MKTFAALLCFGVGVAVSACVIRTPVDTDARIKRLEAELLDTKLTLDVLRRSVAAVHWKVFVIDERNGERDHIPPQNLPIDP